MELGPLVPIAFIVALASVKIAKIYAPSARRDDGAGAEALAQVEDLRHELAAVRAELAETQERLDFAERLLVRPRDEHAPASS